jgi:putative tryptophan/tyrosine transport system substrate-binding protein
MRRRDILRLLCAAALFRPLVVAAQSAPRARPIGWIDAFVAGMNTNNWSEVARELQPLGWIRGSTLQVDRRVPTTPADLANIARELVEAQPDLIVTNGTPSTVAVLARTRTIPVLFFGIADPVGNGLIGNLSRPGRNLTGFASYEPLLAGKWVELLKPIEPRIRRAAILFNPETTPNRAWPFVQEFEATARSLSVEPISAFAHDEASIDATMADLSGKPDGALLVLPDLFTLAHRQKIIGLAEKYRVPAIYGLRYAAVTGGLISYGPSLAGLYRGMASYIDKILAGTSPGELPVQAPATYELVINLRTAKAIGLSIPPALFAAADELIE